MNVLKAAKAALIPPVAPAMNYVYPFVLHAVVDGDTLKGAVDLGFSTSHVDKFRFAHVNAPETSTPEGRAVKTWMTEWAAAQKSFIVWSKSQDKYGRWLAVFWGDDRSVSVNQILLDKGLAVPYM